MKRIIFNILFALLFSNVMSQTISVSPIEVMTSEQTILTVKLENVEHDVTALQFNLSLSDAITLDEGNVNFGEASNNHTLAIRQLVSGDRMFVIYNLEKKLINNGTLLKIPVTMPKDEGTYRGNVNTIRTATTDAVSHTIGDTAFAIVVKPFEENVGTALSDIRINDGTILPVHDLSGLRVSGTPTKKGVYIVGRRKVIVK